MIAAPGTPGWTGPPPTTYSRGMAYFFALLNAERDRWALWIPVIFGTGIAAYFLLSWEPPALFGPAAAITGTAAAALGFAARHRTAGILVMAAGLAVAIWAARLTAA